MNKKTSATIALFIMSIIWGLSYIGVQEGLNNGWGPFAILFVRSGVAMIILFSITFILKKKYNSRKLFIGAFLCSLSYFAAMALQIYGQRLTTVSNTSFITSIYIIMTPVLSTIILKRKEKWIIWVSAIISIIGCFLLNTEIPFSINKDNLLGNLLVLLSAFFFALQIVLIDIFNKDSDPLQLTAVEMLFTTLFCLIAMSIVDDFSFHKAGLVPVILVGVFSSALCNFFQVYGQKYVCPSTSGIIMGLESVFGCLSAVIIYQESMTYIQIIGAILIVLPAIIIHLPYFKESKEMLK